MSITRHIQINPFFFFFQSGPWLACPGMIKITGPEFSVEVTVNSAGPNFCLQRNIIIVVSLSCLMQLSIYYSSFKSFMSILWFLNVFFFICHMWSRPYAKSPNNHDFIPSLKNIHALVHTYISACYTWLFLQESKFTCICVTCMKIWYSKLI